jgi:hypothetical protein
MRRVLLGLSLALSASACTWQTDLPSGATSIPVRADRELLVTDDSPALAALSSNQAEGPLSFRTATSRLPLTDDGSTLRWLDAWSRRLADEGHPDRAAAFDQRVTCAWLKRAPSNACDDACGTCAARILPMDAAPFRLAAVANRTDLSVMPDRAADGGEGRLVFALASGAGDDPAAAPLPMTVIFEYAQVGTALDWTKRWHALGAAADADFPAALAGVAGVFVSAGTLAQVRTADALTGPLVMHQFQIEAGELVAANVRNSPDWSRLDEPTVHAYADANAEALEAGTALMPKAWWASAASIGDEPSWTAGLPEHDALIGATCGGCHAKTDTGFQIDPLAAGKARLSRFLSDPTGQPDELARRVTWMQLTLFQGS